MSRWLCLIALCVPDPTFAQSPSLCLPLQQASSINQRVRLTTDSSVVEGRVSLLRCPAELRIGGQPVHVSQLLAIDARISHPDHPGNGIGIGALVGGLTAAAVAPLASGGDASSVTAGLAGLVTGAMLGFVIDVVRERPGEWIRVWTRDR
jgi:hypothetical protein